MPLMDPGKQMVFIPASDLKGSSDTSMSLSQLVRKKMKSLDVKKVEKLTSVYIPSFDQDQQSV